MPLDFLMQAVNGMTYSHLSQSFHSFCLIVTNAAVARRGEGKNEKPAPPIRGNSPAKKGWLLSKEVWQLLPFQCTVERLELRKSFLADGKNATAPRPEQTAPQARQNK